MQRFRNTITGGERVVPEVLAGFMAQRPGWVPVDRTADGDIEVVLKGAALDAALEEAGLPKSGTADEKRARLTEHVANSITDPPEEQS